MHLFQCDYNKICHPKVLEKLSSTAQQAMVGYGDDEICAAAADKIRKLCNASELSVHFIPGGTQTNTTVIAAALRPYQAVIAAASGHISEHETGAIEGTGHKVLTIPADMGKINPAQIQALVDLHYGPDGPSPEHMPQPKLVYISMSTELGTVYSLAELVEISAVCRKNDLYLYVDGARLGYALAAVDNDVTMADLARLTDAFYMGGTKQGTMFGEAVVIANPVLAQDFRYMIKRQGGMLAKGWLMGLQFEALLEDDLYFAIAKEANRMADQIRDALRAAGIETPFLNSTNQVFAVMSDAELAELSKEFLFTEWERVDSSHLMIRFCTSWATTQEQVGALCDWLKSRK